MRSPLGTSLANAFLSHLEKNWLNSCPQGFKPAFTDVMLTIFLYSSNRMITWSIFKNFEILVTSTCPFLWRQKEKTNFPFLILKLFANKVNFQAQFIVNVLLVVCIVTLRVFYLLFINLVWYTPWFTNVFVFARIGLSSMQNSLFWKRYFAKMVILKTLLVSVLKSF